MMAGTDAHLAFAGTYHVIWHNKKDTDSSSIRSLIIKIYIDRSIT